MEIILTEDVKGLGKQGELKNVKQGYALNYLIPKGLAFKATKANMKKLEEYKRTLEKRKIREEQKTKELIEKLNTISCNITTQAGDDDKLYGSVTNQDIANALKEQGIDIDKRKIILEEPIKKLGVYNVPVHFSQDLQAELKVWVIKS